MKLNKNSPLRPLQDYLTLTKSHIIFFVLLTGSAGFILGLPWGQNFNWSEFFLFLIGLYLSSAGSFAINQAQEWRIDKKMLRTQKRPLVSGTMKPGEAYFIGLSLCVLGLLSLSFFSFLTFFLTLLTFILYNGFYTLIWKKRWMFGAVPGALSGAMPVVIGYSTHGKSIFSFECIYLFLLMFLWQMPHFWILAIRYKEDYKAGNFPVLPLKIGVPKTLYHIGLYIFAYIGLVLMAPFFIRVHLFYIFVCIPLTLKVLYEFWIYFKSQGSSKTWLSFFIWTNLSIIGFVCLPVLDKMLFLFL